MFITKKHISRRAVLKAAGVTLALPFLDAMVPAGTALAQTAAVPKLRTGFFYIPHGAIMGNTSHGPALDKWTPSGSGADFKLSPILASLEPYKKYVSSFGNLENAATAGSVHSFTPATWLSATRPDTGAPRAHMATTLDQVIAKIIGQETPLPSLEVASETIVQSCGGQRRILYHACRSATRNRRLPMEPNPRKVFLQLFGEGDTPQERAIDQQPDQQHAGSDPGRHKEPARATSGAATAPFSTDISKAFARSSGARRRRGRKIFPRSRFPKLPSENWTPSPSR